MSRAQTYGDNLIYPHWHVIESEAGDPLDKAFPTKRGAKCAATHYVNEHYRDDPDYTVESDGAGGWNLSHVDDYPGRPPFNVGPLMCECADDCWMEEGQA